MPRAPLLPLAELRVEHLRTVCSQGCFDVASFIGTCLEPDFRRAHETTLIEHYWQKLTDGKHTHPSARRLLPRVIACVCSLAARAPSSIFRPPRRPLGCGAQGVPARALLARLPTELVADGNRC